MAPTTRSAKSKPSAASTPPASPTNPPQAAAKKAKRAPKTEHRPPLPPPKEHAQKPTPAAEDTNVIYIADPALYPWVKGLRMHLPTERIRTKEELALVRAFEPLPDPPPIEFRPDDEHQPPLMHLGYPFDRAACMAYAQRYNLQWYSLPDGSFTQRVSVEGALAEWDSGMTKCEVLEHLRDHACRKLSAVLVYGAQSSENIILAFCTNYTRHTKCPGPAKIRAVRDSLGFGNVDLKWYLDYGC